jgi:hypothetical protein
MNRLLRSAKFWAAITAAITIISAKLGWKFSAEELAVLTSPFAMVIAAIAAEDVAKAKSGKSDKL